MRNKLYGPRRRLVIEAGNVAGRVASSGNA